MANDSGAYRERAYHSLSYDIEKLCNHSPILHLLQVFVGFAEYHCSCARYTSSSANTALIVGLVVGLVGAFLIALLILIACLLRRRRKQQKAQPKSQVELQRTGSSGYERQLRMAARDEGYSSSIGAPVAGSSEGYSKSLPPGGKWYICRSQIISSI